MLWFNKLEVYKSHTWELYWAFYKALASQIQSLGISTSQEVKSTKYEKTNFLSMNSKLYVPFYKQILDGAP